ncbi:MAG: DUF21 domain-containing protein, partial [Actinobacteria bacterium]|nr:DUF21 domain-containing protein [Actinomycetota bacterium]
MDGWLGLLAVAVLITFNAFFVAGEFALVASDSAKLAAIDSRRSRLVITLMKRLSFHLSGAQIGITVSALLLGFVAEDAFGESLAAIPGINEGATSVAVLSLLVATVLHMVLGELVPKNLAITKPEPVASALSPALVVYGTVAAPVIKSFEATANWVVRRLGIEPFGNLHRLRS